LLEELEYLKIETRLIDEKFASVMGECVIRMCCCLLCVILDFFLNEVRRGREKKNEWEEHNGQLLNLGLARTKNAGRGAEYSDKPKFHFTTSSDSLLCCFSGNSVGCTAFMLHFN
jgi:hypothetical protein